MGGWGGGLARFGGLDNQSKQLQVKGRVGMGG